MFDFAGKFRDWMDGMILAPFTLAIPTNARFIFSYVSLVMPASTLSLLSFKLGVGRRACRIWLSS